ncbi:MAG: ABC transporter permease [Chloroflexi bacterium]|nr:ABC transporter permease [Chloroflexota bacterium]
MTPTSQYLVRRLIQNILLLFVISALSFAFMHLAPGASWQFSGDPKMTQADIGALRASYGLNDPIPVQYLAWLSHVLRGDFGRSITDQRPVLDKIAERLPATIELNIATILIGLLGIPMGVLAAAKRGSLFDRGLGIFNAVANSAPQWWIGLLILLFIAAPTRLLPLGGMYTIGKESDLVDRLWHLILPATVAAVGDWILFSRYLRSSILEVIRQDYVRTAQAKGLRPRVVLWRHTFRNALIPILPFWVFSIAGLISGSILYENTFSWPGIGRLAVQAAFERDYPVVMALTLITSFLTILGFVLIDILYVVVDPRVRYD